MGAPDFSVARNKEGKNFRSLSGKLWYNRTIMTQKINLSPLTGMAELLPKQQLQFEKWKQIVSETYSMYGFTPIDTPVLERKEVLFAKAGGETEKQIYQLTKGDTEMALRFDLTVPLARFVANYQEKLVFPFKRQHIAKVYRGEKPQKGRFREFIQADADIIGRGSLDEKYDAEIIDLIATTIKRLNLGKFIIRINNRKIVTGFLKAIKVMDEAQVLTLLDKAEKIGEQKLKQELSYLRLDTLEIRKVTQFAKIRGTCQEVVQALLALDLDEPLLNQGIMELQTVDEALQALQLAQENFIFDCAIIRGLDYYTGTIFETQLVEAPQLGSICGGGRYENLVGSFGKTKMPGVGMSIGLTRLFAQAMELQLLDETKEAAAQVVVVPLSENLDEILKIVQQLRKMELKTDVYLQKADLKKKMKYVNDLGAPYAVIIGDDELNKKKVQLKNMSTGEQEELNLPQVKARIEENN